MIKSLIHLSEKINFFNKVCVCNEHFTLSLTTDELKDEGSKAIRVSFK